MCGKWLYYKHLRIVAPVAQLDRVADFESEGCRFESCRARCRMWLAVADMTQNGGVGVVCASENQSEVQVFCGVGVSIKSAGGRVVLNLLCRKDW